MSERPTLTLGLKRQDFLEYYYLKEEYYEIKNGSKPKKKVCIETETKDFKQKILDSGYTYKIKQNVLKLYEKIGTEFFGNSRVVEILGCSEVTATSYLKRMEDELKIIVPVEGMGKGKYKFSVCISCGQCNKSCPMGLDVKSMISEGKNEKCTECIQCGACIDACPKNVLKYKLRWR